MRKSIAVACGLTLLAASAAHAQVNPRGEARATVAGKAVAVEYGRPSLKGRDMLGQAQVGQSWRMGADGATTLETEADLVFGTAVVPKGDYVLTARKLAEGKWALVVSRADKTVVAEVPLAASTAPESVETFTIDLKGADKGGDFEMKWGTTVLKAPFTVR
ncbi:MAG TPA: DUF2911 domain-containing protein [Vicinamibacteria bacterium]|nr:DUF2911 domain-containing protein [Vicinamibacteria bacterium]